MALPVKAAAATAAARCRSRVNDQCVTNSMESSVSQETRMSRVRSFAQFAYDTILRFIRESIILKNSSFFLRKRTVHLKLPGE